MEEWLLLLLPIAAASGWYAASRHYKKKYLLRHTENLRQAYCRGLNYLLSEKTDKAIDAFEALLVNDCETVETHIALGNLYRRRGELEKAIEIHEKLLDLKNASPEQGARAHFELGLDYLRAGLFDRAESIFQNLADHEGYRKAALQQLVKIYQHEKDWTMAAQTVSGLLRLDKAPCGETVAQFLCEMAEEALIGNRNEEAGRRLEEALREDPVCVRASLLMGKLHMREGRFEQAMRSLKQVESQNPAYLPEILAPLAICHERLNKPAGELMGYFGYLYETYGLESAGLAMVEHLRCESGAAKASQHLQRLLENKPSAKTLNMLTGLLLEEDAGSSHRDALIRMDRALGRMSSAPPHYACGQCGFSGFELHWRCPSCHHWETTRPLQA
jgi:lipopolysaccharide biosynthesis regulator YciM